MKPTPPRRNLALLLLATLPFACARPIDPAYVKQVDDWHAGRLASLRGETGWLTLVGLHPLHAGANTLGSAEGMDVRLAAKAPARLGTLTLTGDALDLAVNADVNASLQNRTDRLGGTTVALASDASGHPTIVETGGLLFYAIRRGERFFLRVKDPDSEVRRNFTGIDRFPVDPRWRVKAKLERFDPPRKVAVPDVLGGLNQEECPGTLVFRLRGQEYRLTPTGGPGEGLSLVFADATTGRATYGGGRFLDTDPPAADGTVTLDFYRAYNPPCAFTAFATCPLPPDGNKLPLAVEAGEKAYGAGHH